MPSARVAQAGEVADVAAHPLDVAGAIVAVGEVVDAHRITRVAQRVAQRAAEITGAAGHQGARHQMWNPLARHQPIDSAMPARSATVGA